jgi:predicted nucleic acid-binding protein
VSDRRDELVVDASVVVDLVLGADNAAAIAERIAGSVLHAPAHLDAEVLSAIGRLHRAGVLPAREAGERLATAAAMPVRRCLLEHLVPGAWRRRERLRLADALYVELAVMLDVPLLTSDRALGRATRVAEVLAI